ncbi:hypothetical protein CEXT_363741 [Caerostris extrusa]|uniref:Uncharacterized protein n=1 Tax=Caerostris extrusa TaxID=172846 RepID=A0AAV4XZB8_CAEEX|nr:hypothetical protein CEXT_363741 [Caerostris extrusa]
MLVERKLAWRRGRATFSVWKAELPTYFFVIASIYRPLSVTVTPCSSDALLDWKMEYKPTSGRQRCSVLSTFIIKLLVLHFCKGWGREGQMIMSLILERSPPPPQLVWGPPNQKRIVERDESGICVGCREHPSSVNANRLKGQALASKWILFRHQMLQINNQVGCFYDPYQNVLLRSTTRRLSKLESSKFSVFVQGRDMAKTEEDGYLSADAFFTKVGTLTVRGSLPPPLCGLNLG